jgi:hypothetical protein
LLAGRFVADRNAGVVECVVRDLTHYGARIELPSQVIIPSRGWLIVIKRGQAYETEVVWRAGGRCGVKFHQAVTVQEPLPEALNFLRRIWLECAAR